MAKLIEAGAWVDAMRKFIPPEQKLYTWWSYRAPDWAKADKGRRLDHVWVTPDLAPALRGIDVLKPFRAHQPASDHVPVIVDLID
jgi:exodeoxyribonuclease-3